MSPSPLFECRNFHVRHGKITIIPHLNLKVTPGEIITVIGPNGAGKTTLLQALMGLIPSTGSRFVAGEDCSDMDTMQLVAAGIALVTERRELFAEMSVADNLLLGAAQRYGKDKKGVLADLAWIYEFFPRLQERKQQMALTLSGGERQMLALGRALMSRPRLLMLDEPSLGLAPIVVKEIFQKLIELGKTGMSILLVEQNARAALEIASYGYVLEVGEIELEGKASDLMDDERVIDCYLGLSRKQQF